jgi:hypothetical protein
MPKPTFNAELKCPYCGRLFFDSELAGKLIPTHDYPQPCRMVCPGAGQYPRNVTDLRPLWKDDHSAMREEWAGFVDGPPAEPHITTFAIFNSPEDCPGKYVVRRHFGLDGQVLTEREPRAVVDTLAEARAAITVPCVRVPKMAGDMPCLAEVYMQL